MYNMKSNNDSVKIPIPDSVFIRWKLLYQHGDWAQIASDNGFPRNVVERTWQNKKGTIEVISAIKKFYADRQKEAKKMFKGIRSLSNVEMSQ